MPPSKHGSTGGMSSPSSDPLFQLIQTGQFPNLTHANSRPTSQHHPGYNCIAWAAGDTSRKWWPAAGLQAGTTMGGVYWPTSVPFGTLPTPAVFVQGFSTEGWSACGDGGFQPLVVRLAFYVGQDGMVLHAARQVVGGWTSKLGEHIDIFHSDLSAVEGPAYGTVGFFMEKRGALARP